MFEIMLAGALLRAAGVEVPTALDLIVDATAPPTSPSKGGGSKYHDGLTHGHCRLCEASCVLVTGPNDWPWTDRHSGDDACAGAATRDCKPCRAEGWLICEPCTGTGRVPCTSCGGDGISAQLDKDGNEQDCPTCAGTGELECQPCAGRGRFPCRPCRTTGQIPGPHWPWRYEQP